MSLSQRHRRDLYEALAKAYYNLATARALAEDYKAPGYEHDIEQLISELLRIRASIYAMPRPRLTDDRSSRDNHPPAA